MPDKLTATERRACLDACGWTQNAFARMLGLDERTVRKTMSRADFDLPPEVDAWLKRRADAMLADPPPLDAGLPGRASD